jgi:hypothetical protein
MDFATAKIELDTPPNGWFSSQKITFTNGEVADLTPSALPTTPPTASPTTHAPTKMPSGKAGKNSKKI